MKQFDSMIILLLDWFRIISAHVSSEKWDWNALYYRIYCSENCFCMLNSTSLQHDDDDDNDEYEETFYFCRKGSWFAILILYVSFIIHIYFLCFSHDSLYLCLQFHLNINPFYVNYSRTILIDHGCWIWRSSIEIYIYI